MKNIIKHISKLGIFLVVTTVSVHAYSEIAVVVNVNNDSELSKSDIKKIYLAKKRTFPNSSPVVMLDQPSGSKIKKEFGKELLGKDQRRLKAYWSRLIFTGKATPPEEMASDEEIKKFVALNPDAIGYIDAQSVDNSVKVIYKF